MTDTLHQLFSTPILRSNVAVPFKVLEYIKSQKFHRHDTGFMTDEKLLELRGKIAEHPKVILKIC